MKAFFVYSVWCFWLFSLPVQFHTLSLVFITIFHRNTPNTGCPVLGVHISSSRSCFMRLLLWSLHRQIPDGDALQGVERDDFIKGIRDDGLPFTHISEITSVKQYFAGSVLEA